jgi:pimeloyl-ACP methyl ester carboxylesterase
MTRWFCAALRLLVLAGLLGGGLPLRAAEAPKPVGKMVDLGGHRLHVHCTGKGQPTVVVEAGLGDFSFDWTLVQSRVEKFTRVCTYDRAGYAWSDPGPKPRTYAQINLELRDALKKLGERGSFVLVGHSFGGPVVRNFAATYPGDVAGMVLVDAVAEDQRVVIQRKAVRLRDVARGETIPLPRERMLASDQPDLPPQSGPAPGGPIEPPMDRLPLGVQKLQLWAQSLPTLEDAENSQRTWSPEYLSRLHKSPQEGSLGAVPLVVLTRAEGGYGDDLDIPAAQLESERKSLQAQLARLSKNGKQIVVRSGHNMQIEAPDAVAEAIRLVVNSVRHRK